MIPLAMIVLDELCDDLPEMPLTYWQSISTATAGARAGRITAPFTAAADPYVALADQIAKAPVRHGVPRDGPSRCGAEGICGRSDGDTWRFAQRR